MSGDIPATSFTYVFLCVSLSHPPCQHGAGQGNEVLALEEVEALHQLTGSPSDLDCSWTGKDTQTYSFSSCSDLTIENKPCLTQQATVRKKSAATQCNTK